MVMVFAIADANYSFDHWELDGVNIFTSNPFAVFMDVDHSLHAVFIYTPGVPEYPGADISLLAATFAFMAASYCTLKRKKKTHPTRNSTGHSKT